MCSKIGVGLLGGGGQSEVALSCYKRGAYRKAGGVWEQMD